MRYVKITTAFVVLMVLVSCELSPIDDGMNQNTQSTSYTVMEDSTLFVSDASSGLFTFETNDTRYLTSNGYTLWTAPNTNTSDSFESLNVEVTKESGRTEAGFGLVFCAQKIDGKSFMLTTLINTNGYYTVGKISDGVFSHINEGWKSSNYIYRGTGTKNIISVSYDTDSRNFTLKINGYVVTDFTVAEALTFKNSKSGFAAVIANNEIFPSNPVKVTFERK